MFKLTIFCLILVICSTSANEFDELCVGVTGGSFVNDPRSCAGYFHCQDGIADPGRCPDGLFFNPLRILCDWPENVDCVDVPFEPPTPPTPAPTPGPTTVPPSPPPIVECPSSGSYLFPHPQTCSLFILCFGGAYHEMACPTDTHFSVELGACTDPETANCEIDFTVCDGLEDFSLIASTVDCNEYFICFNSTSIRRNCAPNLHFNPIELRCESTHTAGCLISPTPEPDCPQDEFFAVVPHRYSCSHFYYCFNGVGQIQECAPGFLFDPLNLHCDYASNVICLL